MKSPSGHPLVVTGEENPLCWATGLVEAGDQSFQLHAMDAPLSPMTDSRTHVFFSGESEGAIPWAADSWESLEKRVVDAPCPEGRLLLRPHHRHVLADAPACRHWLFSNEPDPADCAIALSPASILVPSMLDACEDHFTRLFEFIAESCPVVILEDFQLMESGQIQCVSMGSGLLDGALMGRLVSEHVPPEVPVLVHARCAESARRWLWPSSTK